MKILVTPHHSLLQKGFRPLLAVRKVKGQAGGAGKEEVNNG